MNGSDAIAYTDGLSRSDTAVAVEGGLSLFVRKVTSDASDPARAIVLHHGARVPSVPSFDLNVDNGSLAADLARRGATVYLADARGYGFSDRPEEMRRPNEPGESSVRSDRIVRDLRDVIAWVAADCGDPPTLLGWATGALWAGHYASLHSKSLSGLVLYNPVYGGIDGHPTWGDGSPLQDPDDPARFNRAKFGRYRRCDGADTLAKWDKSFPGRNVDECRDPVVRDAYVELALQSDYESREMGAGTYRAPSGALEDTYYAMRGRQLYDASFIRVPVLVVRCELDFLAREAEVDLLRAHLSSAPFVRVATIAGASHYAHLDRPACGRHDVIATLTDFLAERR